MESQEQELQKSSREFEGRFQDEGRDLMIARTLYTIKFASLAYPSFWLLDYFASPTHMANFIWIRLGVLAIYLLDFYLLKQPISKWLATALSISVVYASALGVVAMTTFLGGFQSDYYIGILLILFVSGLVMVWSPATTMICGGLTLVSYFALNLTSAYEPGLSFYTYLGPFFFISGSAMFATFGNYSKEKSRRKDLVLRMQIERNHEELKRMDEAKTRFFSNVSHELRTPLMLIIGPLDAIINGRETIDSKYLLDAMASNARRLLRQVNTLLDFARLDAGRLKCSFQPDNIGNVLKDLVVAAKPNAKKRNIELTGEGLENVGDSSFDREKIETVAANLISNAMKFTPEGERITVRTGSDDNRVWFEVEDTGAGIPADQVASIFQRFQQVDDSLSRKTEGTGLGLAMVKELTELHNGQITVTSDLGKGSCFHVELPLVPEPEEERRSGAGRRKEDKAVLARAEAMIGKKFEQKMGSKALLSDVEEAKLEDMEKPESSQEAQCPQDAQRILLVEDNPDLRAFVGRSLSHLYRVEQACDGVEALEKAKAQAPDLIVSDVMMPRMDGYELCKRIRADKSLSRIPMIMVTAKSASDAIVEGLKIGADDYVIKPFQMQELEARIAAHLRSKNLEHSLHERESRLTAIGQMTGSIVHDLRNPVQSIIGYTELAQLNISDEGDDSTVQMLKMVVEDARRLGRMITEVLDFAKGGSTRLQRRSVVVWSYLESLSNSLGDQLDGQNINLNLEHDTDLEDLRYQLDKDRFQRVFENLVKNAREALIDSRDGVEWKNIWIMTGVEEEHLMIRVCDDGPGIPQAIADNLFDAFATSGKAKGTGLGLATVRNLVKAHGGEVSVVPKGCKGGAEFILKFPLVTEKSSKAATITPDQQLPA